jgi:vacuolar-type H+-ATPase subunit H
MENETTLDQLLKIEAKAAALVKDAQEEADRRIQKNEETNRAAYEQCIKSEVQLMEVEFLKEKEKINMNYQKKLDEYKEEISGVKINTEFFSALLETYSAAEG